MKVNYKQLAADIISNVGGEENILDLRHCMTRLRFNLKDESLANDDKIKKMDGVISVVKSSGEYMVVIGRNVKDVYNEVISQLGLDKKTDKPVSTKKVNPINKAINLIMGAMAPSLNVICAGGVIKGILALLAITGVLKSTDGMYIFINALGDAVFWFLPISLGYNLAKKIDMDPFFGFMIGAILCYPGINGVELELFGRVMKATYKGTFLPVILIVLLAKPVDKLCRKIVPKLIANFIVPILVLFIVMPVGYMFIGPFATVVSAALNNALEWLVNLNPLIAGTLLAGTEQLFVILGVHAVILMAPLANVLQGIPSQILAIVSFLCLGQAGAALAVYFKTKDEKLKGIALPAFVSSIFGVSEPTLYGVTLPRPKVLVASLIGAATSGAAIVLFDIQCYRYAGLGVFAAFGLMHPETPNLIGIAVSMILPFVTSFILSTIVFKDDENVNEAVKTDAKEIIPVSEEIFAPVSGEMSDIENSSDPAFSSRTLGPGVVIKPADGKVYAPFKGKVKMVFPTNHAIGIESVNGCELIIHIGVDTVNLKEGVFHAYVKQDDVVEKGQLLIDFNQQAIKDAGLDDGVQIIVTTPNASENISICPAQKVTYGDLIAKMEKVK